MIGLLTFAARAGGLLKAFTTSKVGMAVIAVALIAAGLFALYNTGFVAGRKAGRAEVQATIDQPVTGWKARLATCQGNTVVLQGALASQNDRIDSLGRDSAARLAEAEKGLAAAQRGQAAAEARVAKIMKPLVGADTCLRVIEADQRLMESLR